MSDPDRRMSRRDLFTLFRRPARAPDPPPAGPPVAEINWELCLAYQGQPCDRCITACPVPGAIRVDNHGHPRIDLYACTGCGACEPVCPTLPQALTMISRSSSLQPDP